MNQDQIFTIIKTKMIEILPELSTHTILITDSLKALGANSIDRAEILIASMEEIGVKAPLGDFGHAKNIQDLVSLFMEKMR